MAVRINAHPANLLVDTGSNQLILDAEAAELFGVTPSPRRLLYIRSTRIQGQSLPVGFVQNMSAGIKLVFFKVGQPRAPTDAKQRSGFQSANNNFSRSPVLR
jgi:hypothetical protein